MVWFPTTTSSRNPAAQKHCHLLRAIVNHSFRTIISVFFRASTAELAGVISFLPLSRLTYAAEALQMSRFAGQSMVFIMVPGSQQILIPQATNWSCTRRKTLVNSSNSHSCWHSPKKVPVVHPPLPSESVTSLASINLFLFPSLPCEAVPNPSSVSCKGIIGSAIILSLEDVQKMPCCLKRHLKE